MRATGIRKYNHETETYVKPSDYDLEVLCHAIRNATAKQGFVTDTERLSGAAIKIGLNSRCFSVDTGKLGHNARLGAYISSPKGYKRTDVPTWEQREQFNHIINNIFDRYNLQANVRSGPYIVRTKANGRVDEWESLDWRGNPTYGQPGVSYNGLGQVVSQIIPESEAREACDSDRLEAEHRVKVNARNRETAKARREHQKELLASKYIQVSLHNRWRVDKKFHSFDDKQITVTAYKNLLTKLGKQKRYFKFSKVE